MTSVSDSQGRLFLKSASHIPRDLVKDEPYEINKDIFISEETDIKVIDEINELLNSPDTISENEIIIKDKICCIII